MPKFEEDLVAAIERSDSDDLGTSVEIWADGGVILKNPSPFGGTWAWCAVNDKGQIVQSDSGFVPAINSRMITNNDTEMIAVIKALESMPEHWAGTIYTDSAVTIARFKKIGSGNPELISKINHIPRNVLARAIAARDRVGRVGFRLVKGHPTKQDISRGYKIKKKEDGSEKRIIVSRFNVWCDLECSRISLEHQRFLDDLAESRE